MHVAPITTPVAVVDGKLGADFCARVDVDPGARMRQFADNARNNRYPRAMQNVRHAVMHDRLYRRVAQDHFGVARRRGVSIIYGAHVESERVSQCRDGLHELLRERFGATRLAHYAAGGFNLAIEDARELRQAFEGGAGGENPGNTRSRKSATASSMRAGWISSASPCGILGSARPIAHSSGQFLRGKAQFA